MATTPEEIQHQPTRAARIIDAVVTPVTDSGSRNRVMLAIVAALAALAPLPYGPIAAGILTYVAQDKKR